MIYKLKLIRNYARARNARTRKIKTSVKGLTKDKIKTNE